MCKQGITDTDCAVSLARSWPIRLLRSTTVATATLLIAIAGHTVAGGKAPAPWIAASLLVAMGAGALLFSGRRFELRELVAILVLGQALVHLTCAFAAAPATSTNGTAMLLFHGIATAVTAVVLRHGETFFWRTAEILGLKVVGFLNAPVRLAQHRLPALPVAGIVRSLRALQFGSTRFDRGPPAQLTCCA